MQRVWGFLVIMLWLITIGDATNVGATLRRAKGRRQLGGGAMFIKKHHRAPFKPGPWNHAHATFYEGGSGTFGGACGYDDVEKEGYGMQTAALSMALFNNGQSCGACYEIKCVDDPQWCKPGQPSLVVTGTNHCPPNYNLPSDNGGWCNPPLEHFDIAKPVFLNIAEFKAGIVPITYRRVPCKKEGGIRFTITGNPYYNQVLVWNVGGAGDLTSVLVKGHRKLKWTPMSRSWGQKWITNAMLVGESLTFRVRASDGRFSTSWHIAPPTWQFGQTFEGAYSVNFIVYNNCPFPIWPGALTSSGNQLTTTGFKLLPGSTTTITTAPPWSGRFWSRTLCSTDSNGKFSCATADCGIGQVACNGAGAIPPASLVEFTMAPNGGQDFFDISLVDGFNLPVGVTPVGGSGDCQTVLCLGDVNAVCPPELAVTGQDGAVIACKSACMAFNKSKYCCSGDHSRPETCRPTDYSRIFKNQCPQAYSYAYDDKTSTFTCVGGADYAIIFCPN